MREYVRKERSYASVDVIAAFAGNDDHHGDGAVLCADE